MYYSTLNSKPKRSCWKCHKRFEDETADGESIRKTGACCACNREMDAQEAYIRKHNMTVILVIAAILVALFIGISLSSSGSGSKSKDREWGYCRVCGSKTTLTVKGHYYCSKHYNSALWNVE